MEPSPSEPYRHFITGLRRAMVDDYVAVNEATNPVAIGLNTMSVAGIGYVVEQYSLFPRAIVSFLYGARTAARSAGWSTVDRELTRNLGEELGTETEGVPHAEMLLRGLENGLGLGGVRATAADRGTQKFLAAMCEVFAPSGPVGYVAGAAYALEASAVPELEIVFKAIQRLKDLRQQVGEQYDVLLKFFDAHMKCWEPGHEAGLRSALRRHLESEDVRELFEAGFHAVMSTMEDWWKTLRAEADERRAP